MKEIGFLVFQIVLFNSGWIDYFKEGIRAFSKYTPERISIPLIIFRTPDICFILVYILKLFKRQLKHIYIL